MKSDIRSTFPESTKLIKRMIMDNISEILASSRSYSMHATKNLMDKVLDALEQARTVEEISDIYVSVVNDIKGVEGANPVRVAWEAREEYIGDKTSKMNKKLDIFGEIVEKTDKSVSKIDSEFAEKMNENNIDNKREKEDERRGKREEEKKEVSPFD